MTKDKQIEEMSHFLCGNYDTERGTCCEDAVCDNDCWGYRAAKDLHDKGYRKQEWISVEKRLPENLQEVLAYRGNHIGNLMNTYTYVGGDMWQDEYGFGCRQVDEGITHWMPLPEPPKMKGGAE